MKNFMAILSCFTLVPLFLPFYLAGVIAGFALGAFKGGLDVKSDYLRWVTSR